MGCKASKASAPKGEVTLACAPLLTSPTHNHGAKQVHKLPQEETAAPLETTVDEPEVEARPGESCGVLVDTPVETPMVVEAPVETPRETPAVEACEVLVDTTVETPTVIEAPVEDSIEAPAVEIHDVLVDAPAEVPMRRPLWKRLTLSRTGLRVHAYGWRKLAETEPSVEAPVEVPIEAPVAEARVAVKAPSEEPVEAYMEVPIEAPVVESNEIPIEASVEAPVAAPVEAPPEVPVTMLEDSDPADKLDLKSLKDPETLVVEVENNATVEGAGEHPVHETPAEAVGAPVEASIEVAVVESHEVPISAAVEVPVAAPVEAAAEVPVTTPEDSDSAAKQDLEPLRDPESFGVEMEKSAAVESAGEHPVHETATEAVGAPVEASIEVAVEKTATVETVMRTAHETPTEAVGEPIEVPAEEPVGQGCEASTVPVEAINCEAPVAAPVGEPTQVPERRPQWKRIFSWKKPSTDM